MWSSEEKVHHTSGCCGHCSSRRRNIIDILQILEYLKCVEHGGGKLKKAE